MDFIDLKLLKDLIELTQVIHGFDWFKSLMNLIDLKFLKAVKRFNWIDSSY